MASRKDQSHRYAVIISWSDDPGDKVFVADVPELPGCSAHGDTHEEALANAQDAIAFWLETCEEDGDPLPTPGVISAIMRSEYLDLEKKGIGKTSPDILRAQIDSLCSDHRKENKTNLAGKYD